MQSILVPGPVGLLGQNNPGTSFCLIVIPFVVVFVGHGRASSADRSEDIDQLRVVVLRVGKKADGPDFRVSSSTKGKGSKRH